MGEKRAKGQRGGGLDWIGLNPSLLLHLLVACSPSPVAPHHFRYAPGSGSVSVSGPLAVTEMKERVQAK